MPGIIVFPIFYAADHHLHTTGIVLFTISLFAIIVTSIIGNTYGATNLIQAMAEDKALPSFLAKKDKNDIPRNATLLLLGVSLFVPFIGRSAMGWIVDVNTIGGSIVYGYVSACVIAIVARKEGKISHLV